MSDLRKAAEMALKFCETLGENHWGDRKEVVYTLRAALAQPEPVAWEVVEGTGVSYLSSEPPHPSVVAACLPLYTYPPQRKPLTEDELAFVLSDLSWTGMQGFARAIEKAHGIS